MSKNQGILTTKVCPNCGKNMAPFGEGLWYCITCKIAGGAEKDLNGLLGPLEQPFEEFDKEKETQKEVKKRMNKAKSINLNDLAVKICKIEGGRKNLMISDVKEVMKIFAQELAEIGDHETLKVIHRYKKK